jgi:protein TonB
MRRRRRQNPLLIKTIGVGVIVTILVLPILAELGVFKTLHEEYVETQLINLPPPPPQPKEMPAKAKKRVHPHVEAHRGAKMARATKAATVPVHVQAAQAPAGQVGSGDNSIVNNSGGAVGVVPGGNANGTGIPAPAPPPPIAPVHTQPAPPVVPPATPAPKPDVILEAQPTSQPLPVIPDDLLDSDIDTTFFGYFTIHADGSTDVKMVQGTGNSILDRLAMDAAKKWKFDPATKNGVPVDSYRRLQVQFVVS